MARHVLAVIHWTVSCRPRRPNDLDCWHSWLRRQPFHCACGWNTDCVCGRWARDTENRAAHRALTFPLEI